MLIVDKIASSLCSLLWICLNLYITYPLNQDCYHFLFCLHVWVCTYSLQFFNQSITKRLPLNQPLHFYFIFSAKPPTISIWSFFFFFFNNFSLIPFRFAILFYILYSIFLPFYLPFSFNFPLFIYFLHPHPRIHSSAFPILSMKHLQCCFYVQYMKTNQHTPIFNLYFIFCLSYQPSLIEWESLLQNSWADVQLSNTNCWILEPRVFFFFIYILVGATL